MLKPGGKLIYSSCSIFPSENIKQIENFLSQHPQYQLTDQYTLYPSIHNSDGFFMAELSKK